jgi:hypothetical protein
MDATARHRLVMRRRRNVLRQRLLAGWFPEILVPRVPAGEFFLSNEYQVV